MAKVKISFVKSIHPLPIKKNKSLKSMTSEQRIEHRRAQYRKSTMKYRTQQKEMITPTKKKNETKNYIN